MSDEPFQIPPIPLMNPDKARDVARLLQASALSLAELGATAESRFAERRSQWWLTYAIALAQTTKPGGAT